MRKRRRTKYAKGQNKLTIKEGHERDGYKDKKAGRESV